MIFKNCSHDPGFLRAESAGPVCAGLLQRLRVRLWPGRQQENFHDGGRCRRDIFFIISRKIRLFPPSPGLHDPADHSSDHRRDGATGRVGLAVQAGGELPGDLQRGDQGPHRHQEEPQVQGQDERQQGVLGVRHKPQGWAIISYFGNRARTPTSPIYRNSCLVHLLQNFLGGNSKTLIFVKLNPREEFFNETLNSLR